MTSFDNILDATLDDLADLPQVKPFPAGVHKASMVITLPPVKPGKKQQVMVKFKHQAVVEQVDPNREAPSPDDEAMMFIHIYGKDGGPNEIGQGQLKMLLKPMQEAGLTGNTRELIEATKSGLDVIIVCGEKDYQGQAQMTLSKIELQ